jgi:hypothetical protein
LLGEVFVLVLCGGKFGQQRADRVIFRRLRGPPVEARGFELHLFGEFSGGIERQRTVEPDRPARHKALNVLAPDQRKKVAEFLAMQLQQAVAMADLFLGHLVVHFRRVGIGFAKRVRKGAIDAVVFVFVGNCERQHLLLAQVGKAFHASPRLVPVLY